MERPNTISGKRNLLTNTFMLYLMRFSTYFFAFIAIPYQTRILGPENYGKIVIATALMVYFQLFIDFGFFLSATESVARNRASSQNVQKIFSSVIYGKLLFALASAVFLVIILLSVKSYRQDFWFFIAYFAFTVADISLPDFIYRGMEKMAPITYRTVAVKLIFLILLLVFLRHPDQYIFVPIFNLMGSIIALIWSFYDIRKRFGLSLQRVSFNDILSSIKGSSLFFLSRIAGTLYSSTSSLLLGWADPTRVSSTKFGLSQKLIDTGSSALNPISDSIYPYMVAHKDFRLIKKIILIIEPVIVVFCLIVGFFAWDFCALLFGEEYRSVGSVLIAMLPTAVFVLPDYLFGFPCLSALGAAKHANYSIFLSAGIHIINLVIFYNLGMLNAVTLAALMSFAYFVETAYRVSVVMIKHKNLQKVAST